MRQYFKASDYPNYGVYHVQGLSDDGNNAVINGVTVYNSRPAKVSPKMTPHRGHNKVRPSRRYLTRIAWRDDLRSEIIHEIANKLLIQVERFMIVSCISVVTKGCHGPPKVFMVTSIFTCPISKGAPIDEFKGRDR
jgi:hypothetical protein